MEFLCVLYGLYCEVYLLENMLIAGTHLVKAVQLK